jgi:urocanate hydratase
MAATVPARRARLLLKNAQQIVTVGGGSSPKLGKEMGQVEVLKDHSMLIDGNGKIAEIVPAGAETDQLLQTLNTSGGVARIVDCRGKVVLPGFVDGHTHSVFDGDRSHEHAMKLAGATYEEVHAAGGGINFTVNATRAATEAKLNELLMNRLDAMMRAGTTTCEVKSGYGLDWETELKMMRTIHSAKAMHRMGISSTFLVHAVPKGEDSVKITDDVVNRQLPLLKALVDAGEISVDFIDVFCEKGFFTPEDSRRILLGGKAMGLEASFHGDELNDMGSGHLAAEVGARAVSHLEMLSAEGVAAMTAAQVHAVLLPTTAYLLRLPTPPARALIDSGCPVALASDFNPNAFCFDMPTTMNLACVNFKMTMAEALVAATINGASALNVADRVGSLELGKEGDCFILDAPSWEHVIYQMRPPITEVFKAGESCIESCRPAPTLFSNQTSVDSKKLACIADGIPNELPPMPAGYDQAPHAPRRPVNLTPELCEQALKNALRYFPEHMHEALAPEFAAELKNYGHIYMYRFRPTYDMKAYNINDYPAKSKAAAATMHMIMNNLNPAVAQFPQELVTYGGNGSCFNNWAQYLLTMKYLSEMTDEQTLTLYSGHPMGLFPSHKDAPRVVITNGMVIPNYSSRDDYENMYATGVTQFGQMTAGSFCYIGPQGIVHGTTLTLLNAGRKYLKTQDSLQGKLFISSGLGGMSGAQGKASVVTGVVGIIAEVSEEAVNKRYNQGWITEKTNSVDEALKLAQAALEEGRTTSIGYHGNVVDLWERLAEEPADSILRPHLGSDQTSCHNPFAGGYYPVGMSFEDANEMMADDPAQFKQHVQSSLKRQIAAINTLTAKGLNFFDYGNSFLLESSRAGADVLHESSKPGEPPIFRYPSYVQDIMGDIFSLGFGPFRWVCTSANPEDLAVTDSIALEVMGRLKEGYQAQLSSDNGSLKPYASKAVPQLNDNMLWIREAEEHKLVVGSQARILYANAAARTQIALAMNEAIKTGRLSAPVVLSRDHHDVSGTDAPWRETSNITDGSKFCADMSIHNIIGDACRGATSVSIHNGGGTGWGEATNGGFQLVLDGTADAHRRAEQMLHWDVFNGVSRRAWAGNDNALDYTKAEQRQNDTYTVQYPNKISDENLKAAMSVFKK